MKKTIAAFAMMAGLTMTSWADDSAVVAIDIVRAKSIAIAAIKEKYPATDLAALRYAGLEARASTNDQIAVIVSYLLSGSGTSEDIARNGIKAKMTKQTTYVVEMDSFGKHADADESTQISISSGGIMPGTGAKPSEGTR